MDNNDSPNSSWIPEGYIEVIGPNGQQYLVPHFYAPALNNSLEGAEEKKKLNIEKAAGTVRFLNVKGRATFNDFTQVREFYSSYFGIIGEEMIMAPMSPVSVFLSYSHIN
jgi:hypothetical protein